MVVWSLGDIIALAEQSFFEMFYSTLTAMYARLTICLFPRYGLGVVRADYGSAPYVGLERDSFSSSHLRNTILIEVLVRVAIVEVGLAAAPVAGGFDEVGIMTFGHKMFTECR